MAEQSQSNKYVRICEGVTVNDFPMEGAVGFVSYTEPEDTIDWSKGTLQVRMLVSFPYEGYHGVGSMIVYEDEVEYITKEEYFKGCLRADGTL